MMIYVLVASQNLAPVCLCVLWRWSQTGKTSNTRGIIWTWKNSM